MGILDKVACRVNSKGYVSTGKMYFGNPEAESEKGLVEYFNDYLG